MGWRGRAALTLALVVGGVWIWGAARSPVGPQVDATRRGTVDASSKSAHPAASTPRARAVAPGVPPSQPEDGPAAAAEDASAATSADGAFATTEAKVMTAKQRLDTTRIATSRTPRPYLAILAEVSARAHVEVYVERSAFNRMSEAPGGVSSAHIDDASASHVLELVARFGSLVVDVQPQRVVLRAKDGAAPDEASLDRVPTVRTGADGTASQIVVVVLDEWGAAVADAEIWSVAPLERRATTNRAGEASVDWPVGRSEWFARRPGLVDSRAVAADTSNALELRLGGLAARVEGSVRTKAGVPVPGARVEFVPAERESLTGNRLPHVAVSGADGTFTDASVPPGPTSVQVSAEGFATTTQVLDLTPAQRFLANVALAPQSICVGTVRDREGKPVRFVRVEAKCEGSLPTQSAVPRTDGTFRIGALAAGRVTFTVAEHRRGVRMQVLASTTIELAEGETVKWDPVIDRPIR